MLSQFNSRDSLAEAVLAALGYIQLTSVETVQLRLEVNKRIADVLFVKIPAPLAIVFNEQESPGVYIPLIREVRLNFDLACARDRACFNKDAHYESLSLVVNRSLETLIGSQ